MRGTDLSGTDLSGTDLSGTDLSGTDLSGTDLSGTDLSGTDLSGTDIWASHSSATIPAATPIVGGMMSMVRLSGLVMATNAPSRPAGEAGHPEARVTPGRAAQHDGDDAGHAEQQHGPAVRAKVRRHHVLQPGREPVEQDTADQAGRRGLRPNEPGNERGDTDRDRRREESRHGRDDHLIVAGGLARPVALVRLLPPFPPEVGSDQHR